MLSRVSCQTSSIMALVHTMLKIYIFSIICLRYGTLQSLGVEMRVLYLQLISFMRYVYRTLLRFSWFDERGARRFEPFLEFSNTILLVPCLPMGDLAIAIAVISGFAFDTARWLAFG